MKSMINLVILGYFPYPHGMANTKRVQHIVDGLRAFPEISLQVVVTRQVSAQNVLAGRHCGVPYRTLVGDALRWRFIAKFPSLLWNSGRVISSAFDPGKVNLLYVYGPPALENIMAIRKARRLGYNVVFDIVEDYDFAHQLSRSLWHKANTEITRYLIDQITTLADGIVVISSHLEKKYQEMCPPRIPVHLKPVSVDLDLFPPQSATGRKHTTLFYSGSFAVKDGVPVLLDAFDALAARHGDLGLVLTGVGNATAMQALGERIKRSPYSDRIAYLGYLDDTDYYAALNRADIPCMTRINIGFAQAGFPFKLGEFLATGKPVVASRVSDVASLMTDRDQALLVEPGDMGQIVDAVDFILDDPDRAAAIGRRGRLLAGEVFDYRAQGRALYDFLQSVIDAGRAKE